MPRLDKFKLPARASKVPKPRQPDGIRMRYFAELRPFLRDMRAEVNARVKPMLATLVQRHKEHTHTDAMPAGKRAQSLMAGATKKILKKWPNERLHGIAVDMGNATSKFQKQQLFNQAKAAVNVNIGSLLDKGISARVQQFAAQNVSLIRTVQTRYLGQVEQVVLNGISNGSRASDIASELSDRYDVAESNAMRIARDQIGKLNGQLNAVRQQQLGIDKFTWRTMHDQRVRDEHAELDGETFSYDNPPMEGLPGEPINCRCYAEPDFQGLLDSQ